MEIRILNLLCLISGDRGTVNPLVEGSSPSGPTILIEIMALWRRDQGIHSPLVYAMAECPFTANSGAISDVYRMPVIVLISYLKTSQQNI